MPDDVFPADPIPSFIGSHQVVAVLGESSTTEVLLATTRGPRGFSRPVVIKRLRESKGDEITGRYLAREALAYTRLNHPNIVRLYEFLEEEGQLALVIEYVHGISLARVRSLLRQRREALSDGCVFYVMSHVFAALAAAHAARDPWTSEFVPVIHRDVSPSNVLIAWDGSVKLTDFGIAKLGGMESDTRAGLLKGTYGYMAPEQVLGDPITPRTDIYSACLLLRELLLRRRTFVRGTTPELEFLQLMARPALDPIEALRTGVPPEVCHALRLGLRLNPDDRNISAGEVRDLLAATIHPREARKQLVATLSDIRPPDVYGADEQNVTTYPCESQTVPTRETRESFPSYHSRDVSVSGVLPLPESAPPVPLPTLPAAPRRKPTYAAAKWALLIGVTAATIAASLVVAQGDSEERPAPELGLARIVNAPAPPSSHLPPLTTATLGIPTTVTATPVATTAPVPPAAVRAAVSSPIAPTPTPTLTAITPAPVTASAAITSAPTPPLPPDFGILRTPQLPHSHRVFVGTRVLGQTGDAIRLRCGTYFVKVGSQGRAQSVQVPCGGEVSIDAKW